MALRVITTEIVTDDIDGSEGATAQTFTAPNGTRYEIDLTEANAAALSKALEDAAAVVAAAEAEAAALVAKAKGDAAASLAAYVKAGRKVGKAAAPKRGKSSPGTPGSDLSKADRDAIREWSRTPLAAKQGIAPLGDRGRIPAATIEAWQATR